MKRPIVIFLIFFFSAALTALAVDPTRWTAIQAGDQGAGTPDNAIGAGDLYVVDGAEIDGELRADGIFDANGAADFASTVTFNDVATVLAAPAYQTGFTINGTARMSGFALYDGNAIIGDGVPDQTLDGEDLYVEGLLEVDGIVYADSGIVFENEETITNGVDGTLDFGAANLTTTGTLSASGTPSGPLVAASAANTACDTTCGSEANCAFGQNTGDMALVDCDGATADVCFCYTSP